MAEDSDDDVFDNWEDFVDTGALEKKLEIMKPKDSTEECTNCRDAYVCTEPVILQGDSCRTQFVQAQPRMKILKRPSGGGGGGGGTNADGFVFVNGERVQKQPIKTLQQREAEYAEARLRILGAAKSDEEIAEEKLAKLTIAPTSTDGPTTTDDAPCVVAAAAAVVNSVTESGVKPTSAAAVNLIQVTRPPKGPDGTAGFTHFR